MRLTDKISADHRLPQESEGTVVQIVLDPEEKLDPARGEVALEYCPRGIWVCFDDCNATPLASRLIDKVNVSAREALWRLNASNPNVAIEPDSKVKPAHERMALSQQWCGRSRG